MQESLGSGSGGEVNLAWDTRIQRNVAIKRIPLPAHAGGTEMIPGLEEARTGAQLHDSRIVNVFDFEVTDDEALLIMEFVDGISLGALMDRIPRILTLDEIASVVQNVGKALSHAHANHVLHLDVKPDNILIDTSGQSKVTDFGIGRLARAAGFGQATAGTIGYMPPEQIRGEEVTERTDQWAFAALVYELLVGEDPFIADTFEESLEMIEQGEIVLPSSVDDEIDEEVDDILFRALSIDPERRYPSVAKFVSALMPHLGSPKTGRTRMGRLVGLFADEVALGSPEERLAAVQRMEGPDDTAVAAFEPPLSEDDEDFYDADELPPTYADEDPYDVAEERNPYDERMLVRRRSWRSIIGERGAAAAAHVAGGACNGALAFIGAMAIPLPQPWMNWVMVAAAAALGAAWPRIGSLVSLGLVGAGLIFSQWVPQGIILLVLALVWWGFLGRTGWAESNCVVLGPAAGMLNLAYLAPIFGGWLMPWRKTLFTALFGVALMLLIAPLTGSGELYHTGTAIIGRSISHDAMSTAVYANAGLWIEAVGWLAAALGMSALTSHGSKVWCFIGAVAATAIIVVSRVAHGYAVGLFQGLFTVESVAAMALPLLIACVAIWLHDPAPERPNGTKMV